MVDISSSAFSGCSELNSVVLPAALKTIGGSAFKDCVKLTGSSFTLPNSLETIYSCAFQGCTGLTSVSLPASLKTLGSGDIFYDISGIKRV